MKKYVILYTVTIALFIVLCMTALSRIEINGGVGGSISSQNAEISGVGSNNPSIEYHPGWDRHGLPPIPPVDPGGRWHRPGDCESPYGRW